MKEKALKLITWFSDTAAYFVWAIGVGTILGSLYFSEVRNFPPCELCWWTRILMYPIAIIMSVALLQKKPPYWRGYVLAFSGLSLLLTGFQSLLQWGIINENVASCSVRSAVSCAEPEIMWLGFITIPFLGFITSVALIILTLLSDSKGKLYTWLKKTLS